MNHETIAAYIADGKAVLGIEFGSTRIKAVLIGDDHAPIASGDHTWENRLEDGIWTYHLDDVWAGVQDAFANLQKDVQANYGVTLTNLAAFGVSGMMHGFLAFDENGRQLAQFRTWRNTMTAQAAEKLTALLGFNIPQRWSIAHLVQAMMNGEAMVPQIHHLTTLAGYVHYKLCGKNCLGIGEASGMFPIDSDALDYDQHMLDKVDALAKTYHMPWTLREILPCVLCAGEDAGVMTAEGAKLLDPTGTLQPGALMAPPEGDAGTGMAATNSVAVRTGNVSAGTSTFAMVVLEKPLYHYTAARRGSLSNSYHPERLEDNFYLSDAVWDTVAAWGLQDSPMHRAKASYCTIRDLMMGIKNLGCSPLSLSEQTAWLRSTLQKPRVRTAVRSTPLHAMQSRNDQVKLLLLKLRLCRAVLLLSGANQRKNT